MLSPNPFMDRTKHDGSVIVADDGTQSDGQFIQTALSFDPDKMNADLMHLSYLGGFINLHETGHHTMGRREELAEQYGALKFRQAYPEHSGALKMMRDFRNAHFLISDNPHTLMLYGLTSKSLDRVIAMDQADIDAFSEEEIRTAARSGHKPNQRAERILEMQIDSFSDQSGIFGPDPKDMLNMDALNARMRKLGTISQELALRVALFEEYQRQEHEQNVRLSSGISNYYLAINETLLNISKFWKQDNASLEGMLRDETILSDMRDLQRLQNGNYEADLDPKIMQEAITSLRNQYEPGSLEQTMLTNAAEALNNFNDPLQAYGLTRNFGPKPEWNEPVLSFGLNFITGVVEYDGFKPFHDILERWEEQLAPPDPDNEQTYSPGLWYAPSDDGISKGEIFKSMEEDMLGVGDPEPN